MSVKLFCIYNKPSEIFKSDAVEPIQTGCNDSKFDLGFLKDNTGDNIADKNFCYAELTAWYWVWKNYLKQHRKVDYIGFCHYRRFLDFYSDNFNNYALFSPKSYDDFREYFKKNYTNDKIYDVIKDYDAILPEKFYGIVEKSVYEQYARNHGHLEIDILIDLIKKEYPKYQEVMEEVLNGRICYFCLNFVLKRELYEDFMAWTFGLLDKLMEILISHGYENYKEQKIPAYLIERFFNVWLQYKIKTTDIKILERPGIKLC